MKALMILGAIIGFLIGAGFALARGNPWATALWHACAAAFGAAVLTRWWIRVWADNLREALERREEAEAAAAAPPSKPGK